MVRCWLLDVGCVCASFMCMSDVCVMYCVKVSGLLFVVCVAVACVLCFMCLCGLVVVYCVILYEMIVVCVGFCLCNCVCLNMFVCYV